MSHTIEGVKIRNARKVLNELWSAIVVEAHQDEYRIKDYRLDAIDELSDEICLQYVTDMLVSGHRLIGNPVPGRRFAVPAMRD